MNILITGGSGFIGTNLVNFYLNMGVRVLNLDILPPRNSSHVHVWRKLDLMDRQSTIAAINEFSPDYCFHLAARTDLGGHTLNDYSSNTSGLQNVLDALTSCASLRLAVFASSMLVCRLGYTPKSDDDYCPSTTYGFSKVQGEKMVRLLGNTPFRWVIVRPTSIWGPWFSSPYKDFFNAIKSGIYLHPRGVRVFRSYGFVLNTIFQLDAIRRQGAHMLHGKTIYLADYEPLEIHSWALDIQRQMDAKPIKEVPLALLRFGAFLGDVFSLLGFKSVPLTSFRLKNLLTSATYDLTGLREVAGILPFSTLEGIRKTCNWIKGCTF